MTAAFWFQIAIAALLVVLAAMSLFSAWLYAHLLDGTSFMVTSGPVTPALLLAVWLAVTAVGLRRGRPVAYWLSLAGLVLPPLAVAAVFLFVPATYVTEVGISAFGPTDAIDRLLAWQQLSMMAADGLSAIALVLAASAAGMLLTRTSRRYFGRSVD